jgi:hypothetical protein
VQVERARVGESGLEQLRGGIGGQQDRRHDGGHEPAPAQQRNEREGCGEPQEPCRVGEPGDPADRRLQRRSRDARERLHRAAVEQPQGGHVKRRKPDREGAEGARDGERQQEERAA